MKRFRSATGLVFWITLSYSAGLVELIFPPGEWALSLETPGMMPPGWIFIPLWIVLYFLMGVSAWLVWKEGGFPANRVPLSLFILQLVLNGLWTWIYFGTQRIGLALAEMMILDAAVAVTTLLFWRKSLPAGVLLLPYLGWLLVTTYLVFEIWRLNVPG